MAGRTSRVGQRVDRVKATDEPHERYTADGVPVLHTVVLGNRSKKIIQKNITVYTVCCPDCDIPAIFDENEQAICTECGMLCSDDAASVPHHELVRDPKAAERVAAD